MSKSNVFDIDYDAITREADKRVESLAYLSEIVNTEIASVLVALRKVADFVQELDDIGDTVRSIDFDKLPADVRAILNLRGTLRQYVDFMIGAGDSVNNYSLSSLAKYATANVEGKRPQPPVDERPLLVPNSVDVKITFEPRWHLLMYPNGIWVCKGTTESDVGAVGTGPSPGEAYAAWEAQIKSN